MFECELINYKNSELSFAYLYLWCTNLKEIKPWWWWWLVLESKLKIWQININKTKQRNLYYHFASSNYWFDGSLIWEKKNIGGGHEIREDIN